MECNPGNPPIFKPINPGLCAGQNPGVSTADKSMKTKQKAL